ncbi:MAG TPA: ABC transporter ATP-binding protein [Candidatus Dormibacteraeota bacterium]
MIEVQGLTKRYGDRTAIEDVSFTVPSGQILGFLGPNGAGKSTTMRILTGYISATDGSAAIAGFDVFTDSREVRRRTGYLPETTPLHDEMRVVDYLEHCCRLRGVAPGRRRQRIDFALDACGLGERRREIIGRLSRGLRQRVGIAQAVVHDPELLILDEPTSGLDPAQTRETRELIKQLGREHTVVLSSHILPEVSATCERVLIVSRGRLVADGTPTELAGGLRDKRLEVELVVRGALADVRRRLEAVAGVDQVDVAGLPDGECRAVVTAAKDLREELARAVVELGLRELRSRGATLEDVFLQLTTEEPTAS